MFKKALFAFCLLALTAVPRAHALPGLDIDLSVGTANRTPSGTVEVGGGGSTPTSANLKDDLNLGDHADLVGQLKVKHAIPFIPNFYINYLPMSFSGDKTGTSNITYGGQTFQANTLLHTELTLNAVDVGLFYDIPLIKTATAGIIDPEIGLNVRSLSFSGKLTGTVGGVANTTVEKTASIPVPMLYIGLGVYPIHLLSFNAQYKALSLGGNSITEWGVEMGIHPMPVLYLALGYSTQNITLDTDNIKTSIGFSGPYAAIGASF